MNLSLFLARPGLSLVKPKTSSSTPGLGEEEVGIVYMLRSGGSVPITSLEMPFNFLSVSKVDFYICASTSWVVCG